MCTHSPNCPTAESPDACAARIAVSHPEQGWCLLCNGIVYFDDGGALRPDCSEILPAPVAAVA